MAVYGEVDIKALLPCEGQQYVDQAGCYCQIQYIPVIDPQDRTSSLIWLSPWL